MKQKFLISLLCLATIFLGYSCSDDDEEVQVIDPNDLLFRVNELAATSSSYTFQIEASDHKTPFLCLYVDKSVIDKVPNEKLHTFLMEDLKKQAEAKNQPFEEYLASISHYGIIPEMKLTGLIPGGMYELVMFGINGTQPAMKPFCHFFQTPLADLISCKFDVEFDNQPGVTYIKVKPENKEVKYFNTAIEKKYYQPAVEQGMNDLQILANLFNQQLDQVLGMMVAPGAPITEEVLQQALDQLLISGDQTFQVGRPPFSPVMADTDFVWLGVAMYVSPDFDIVFISDPTKAEFHTLAPTMKETTFEFFLDKVTQTSAHVRITPSDTSQVYVCRVDKHNPSTEKMSDMDLARYIVETNPWIQFEAQPHGVIEYKNRKLCPDTKHYMLAFGFEGGICTKVFRKDFDPLPAGDPTAVTFDVEILDNTSNEIMISVTPSDESVFYLPLLYPSGEDKNVMMGRLISDWNRMLDRIQNDPMIGDPYATLWDIIEQYAYLGKDKMIWSSVTPGQSMDLLMLTFNKKGIAASEDFRPNFITIPGLSNTVKVDGMEVFGVFSGDDEKGEIFNQPWATEGKAIVAMTYKCSKDAARAFSTSGPDEEALDELDPQALTDDAILGNSQLGWTRMQLDRPFQFMVSEWEKSSVSYSFGMTKDGERGTIARAMIPAPKKSDVKDIQILKDLIADLNKGAASATAYVAPAEPEWAKFKKEINIKDCIGQSVTKKAEQAEEIRVPFRPKEETSRAAEQQNVLKAAEHLSLVHPVR